MDLIAARYPTLAIAAALVVLSHCPDRRGVWAAEAPATQAQPRHGIECRCRANGRSYQLGEKICLKTPAGYRVAECQMSQNVTSWALAKDDCMVNAQLDIPLPSAPNGGEAR
jgi:hypothetical protein